MRRAWKSKGSLFVCVIPHLNTTTEFVLTVQASYPLLTVNVESESAYEPQDLLPAAISVMRDKIAAIRRSAEALLGGQGDPVEMGNA
jgi:hypothetical protein